MVEAFMIKYKIKLNGNFNYSDYRYQKIFRAIYGYLQIVSKTDGKKYVYHRPGVLSQFPFIKKSKNEVIVPKEGLSKLIDFLKTGKNPTHNWVEKGNWNATYTMYDVDVSEESAIKAMQNLVKNTVLFTSSGENKKLINLLESLEKGVEYDSITIRNIVENIKKINNLEWGKLLSTSSKFTRFNELVSGFKKKYNLVF
jgi:hypothetical protein